MPWRSKTGGPDLAAKVRSGEMSQVAATRRMKKDELGSVAEIAGYLPGFPPAGAVQNFGVRISRGVTLRLRERARFWVPSGMGPIARGTHRNAKSGSVR